MDNKDTIHIEWMSRLICVIAWRVHVWHVVVLSLFAAHFIPETERPCDDDDDDVVSQDTTSLSTLI